MAMKARSIDTQKQRDAPGVFRTQRRVRRVNSSKRTVCSASAVSAYEAGHHIGAHAAAAIGADPSQVFKALMVEGKPGCAPIPLRRAQSRSRGLLFCRRKVAS